MADVEDYLQEGFDPRSVTVPRLRSILVMHNVEYPSTAKKSQLVELVTQQVLPQAPKLRAQRARAKRSSYGIVNAGSAESHVPWDDHDLPPPPSRSRPSTSPRKASARIKIEEDKDTVSPPLRSPRKRSSRSTSRQIPQLLPGTDDAASESSKPTRRRQRRTITPLTEPESELGRQSEEELPSPADDEATVFTDDNPFQSGSSPPVSRKSSGRRRMVDEEPLSILKTSSRHPSRTKSPASLRAPTPRPRSKTPDAAFDPGEEFTPDAQLELEEAQSRGEISPHAMKSSLDRNRPSSIKNSLLVLLLTLLGAYGAWYRQEKIAVGYCGLGRPPKDILPQEISLPDFLMPFIEPQCEQCPPHAFCYEDFSVRCEQGFILKPHPLSLAGLVPLPPSCEPDGEKARRVRAVANKAVEELRERRAKYECGNLVGESGQSTDSPAMTEQDLKESVSRKRNKRLNDQEFDELWAAAIGEVTARDEVVVEIETTPTPDDAADEQVRKLSSTSLALLPLSCAVKRSLWLGLARYRIAIGLLTAIVAAFFFLRSQYQRHVATSAQIPALVELVLDRLATQKELGEEEIDDPWLFLPNLRDDVLRSIHSLSERERIWRRVRQVVEQNSNVRTGQRESRSGEVGRAWEWIGPVRGEGARRRRSGRVSWAADVKTESPEPKEMAEIRRWEEQRPIY